MAELEAGWYRYISQWTFHIDGTIKPRFGFAGVQNLCICNVHHHHAYWRLDFDIGSDANNFVQQYANGAWQTARKEARVFRDAAGTRRWRVGNRGLQARYEIRPSLADGTAAASPDWPFPVADLWFLRYRASEIDDGVNVTTGSVAAQLNKFLNGESIYGADVVAWYAAHFTHDQAVEEEGGHGHMVGPDLVPISW
jgi:Cu2+-containing amine oxidase